MATWWPFVNKTIGEQTRQSVALKSGFDQSAFNRWESGTPPDAAFVVKFARGNGLNVLHALEMAEYISAEEADTHDVPADLSTIDSLDLACELVKRLTPSPKQP